MSPLPRACLFQKHKSCSRWALAAACCVLLSSCSTTVNSDVLDPSDRGAAIGLVYYLPIRSLTSEAKFQLLDCGLNNATAHAELLYDVTPTVTSGLTADRRRAFVISKGLDGRILKAMNFEVAQYENGTLKSLNLVADDRTAETATNVLSGVLKFGLGLTGSSFFSGDRSQDPHIIWLRFVDISDLMQVNLVRAVCGAEATEALLKVHALTRQLSGAREASEAKSTAAAKVTEAEKSIVEARASLKEANGAGGAEDIAQAKQVLAAAVVVLGEARSAAKSVPAASASTAITQDIAATVQRHLTFAASDIHIPSELGKIDQWSVIYPAARLQAIGINAAKDLKAVFRLSPLFAQQKTVESAVTFAQPENLSDGEQGIWFRSPAQAALEVFADEAGATTSRLKQYISVPQWGQLTRLPLRNRAFAKNTTKISFAPDGTLLSLSSDSTSAAERTSGAFAQSGEMFLDFATKRRALLKELTSEESAAGKAAVQEQIDLLSLEQQLAAAKNNIGPEREAQLSALNFQIQQTQKQIELLELQAKLQVLQPTP